MANKLFNLVGQPIVAVESISFQDGKLFKELTDLCQKVKDLKGKLLTIGYDKCRELREIESTIFKYTGLDVTIFRSYYPNIFYRNFKSDHVFNDTEIKDDYNDDAGLISDILYTLNKEIIKGTVDLNKSKVTGDFSKIKNYLGLSDNEFLGNMFTAEEVAAIILHEIGHVFVNLEFLDRAVSTNQCIAALTRSLDRNIDQSKKSIVIKEVLNKLPLSKEELSNLEIANDPNVISIIIVDNSIRKSKSELGGSIFDITFCEYLADQFATRQGAGRHLITALDKLQKAGGYSAIDFASSVIFAIIFAPLIPGIIATTPLWLTALVFLVTKEQDGHRTGEIRFSRIKNEYLNQLKNKELPKEVQASLLFEIAEIDKILKDYKENLSIIETLAYYLRPGYRNAHKYELLQRDLEKLGSSDLFTAAAKLKTI